MPTLAELYGNPLNDIATGAKLTSRTRAKQPKPVEPEEPDYEQEQDVPTGVNPYAKRSVLSKAGDAALSGLAVVGNALDLPGSSVRDILAGQNPADQWMTPFTDENRTTGRDLMRKYGMVGKEDNWLNFGAGLAAEMALDPTSYIGVGLLSKGAGTAAKKAGLVKNLKPKVNASLAKKAAQTGETAEKVGWMTARMRATPSVLIQESDEPAAALKSFYAAGGTDDMLDKPIYTMLSASVPWASWIPGLNKTKLATSNLELVSKTPIKRGEEVLKNKPPEAPPPPPPGPSTPPPSSGPDDQTPGSGPNAGPVVDNSIPETGSNTSTATTSSTSSTPSSTTASSSGSASTSTGASAGKKSVEDPGSYGFTVDELMGHTKLVDEENIETPYKRIRRIAEGIAQDNGGKVTLPQMYGKIDEIREGVGETVDGMESYYAPLRQAQINKFGKQNIGNKLSSATNKAIQATAAGAGSAPTAGTVTTNLPAIVDDSRKLTDDDWNKSALPKEQAADVLGKIRAGTPESKNQGVITPESVKEPMVLAKVPLSAIPEDVIENLKNSKDIDAARVDRYAAQGIDTPVNLTDLSKSKVDQRNAFGISDGAHRILAAVKNGAQYISAYVPASTKKMLDNLLTDDDFAKGPLNAWQKVDDTTESMLFKNDSARAKVTLNTADGSAHIDDFSKNGDAAKGTGKQAIQSIISAAIDRGVKTLTGNFKTHSGLGALAYQVGKQNVSFLDRSTGKALDITFEEAMKNPERYTAKVDISPKVPNQGGTPNVGGKIQETNPPVKGTGSQGPEGSSGVDRTKETGQGGVPETGGTGTQEKVGTFENTFVESLKKGLDDLQSRYNAASAWLKEKSGIDISPEQMRASYWNHNFNQLSNKATDDEIFKAFNSSLGPREHESEWLLKATPSQSNINALPAKRTEVLSYADKLDSDAKMLTKLGTALSKTDDVKTKVFDMQQKARELRDLVKRNESAQKSFEKLFASKNKPVPPSAGNAAWQPEATVKPLDNKGLADEIAKSKNSQSAISMLSQPSSLYAKDTLLLRLSTSDAAKIATEATKKISSYTSFISDKFAKRVKEIVSDGQKQLGENAAQVLGHRQYSASQKIAGKQVTRKINDTLLLNGKRYAVIDSKDHAIVQSKYPGAQYHFPTSKRQTQHNGLVTISHNGEFVGVIQAKNVYDKAGIKELLGQSSSAMAAGAAASKIGSKFETVIKNGKVDYKATSKAFEAISPKHANYNKYLDALRTSKSINQGDQLLLQNAFSNFTLENFPEYISDTEFDRLRKASLGKNDPFASSPKILKFSMKDMGRKRTTPGAAAILELGGKEARVYPMAISTLEPLDRPRAKVVAHEMFHVILYDLKNTDPELYKAGTEAMQAWMTTGKAREFFESVYRDAEEGGRFSKYYGGDVDEIFAEMGALGAMATLDAPPKVMELMKVLWTKAIEYIKKAVFGKKLDEIGHAQAESIKNFVMFAGGYVDSKSRNEILERLAALTDNAPMSPQGNYVFSSKLDDVLKGNPLSGSDVAATAKQADSIGDMPPAAGGASQDIGSVANDIPGSATDDVVDDVHKGIDDTDTAMPSPDEKEAWRASRTSNPRPRNQELQAEVLKYMRGGSQQSYFDAVRRLMPIEIIRSMPKMATWKEIQSALSNTDIAKGIIGVTRKIKNGERVGTRLDIPSYRDYDTWIVTVHNPKSGASVQGYGKAAKLSNVNFTSSATAAINIARGETQKSSFAKMIGNWVDESPESIYKQAQDAMNNPDEWIQVGMNPERHSWFYIKESLGDFPAGTPVKAAKEVLQVGPLVMVKKDGLETAGKMVDGNLVVDSPEFMTNIKNLPEGAQNVKFELDEQAAKGIDNQTPPASPLGEAVEDAPNAGEAKGAGSTSPDAPQPKLKDIMSQGTAKAAAVAKTVGDWLKELPEGLVDPIAKAIDEGANLVMAIPGVPEAIALLDRNVMGAVKRNAQEISRLAMESIDRAHNKTRQAIIPLVRAVEGTKHFDIEDVMGKMSLSRDDAIKLVNERAMAFRAFCEGVETSFYGTKEIPDELQAIGMVIRQMTDDAIEFEAKKAGLDVKQLKDEHVLYIARQARKPGKAYSRNPLSGPLFEVEFGSMKGRDEFLKDLPGGTSVIDEMSIDPKISGIIQSAPTVATGLKKALKFRENADLPNLVQQRMYVHETYGPKLDEESFQAMKAFLPDDGSKTWQQAWKEGQQHLREEAEKALLENPEAKVDLFDPMKDKRYDQMIAFINNLDPAYAKENAPFFGRNILHDTMQRVQNGQAAAYAAMAAQKLVGQTLQISKTTKDSQGIAFEKLLGELKIDTPKSLQNIINNMPETSRKALDDMVNEHADEIMDKIRKIKPEAGKYKKVFSYTENKVNKRVVMAENGQLGLLKKKLDGTDDFVPLDIMGKDEIVGLLQEKMNRLFLAQHNIPKDTADAMTRWMQPFTSPEEIGALRNIIEQFTNIFRANVTAPFPAFHIRNLGSATVQNVIYKAYDPEQWGPMRYLKPMYQAWQLRNGENVTGLGRSFMKLNLLDESHAKAWVDSQVNPLKRELTEQQAKKAAPEIIDALKGRINEMEAITLANADPATLDAIATRRLADLAFENSLTGSKQGQAAEVIGDTTSILRSQVPGLDNRNPLKGQFTPAPSDATMADILSPNMVAGGRSLLGGAVDSDYFILTRMGRDFSQLTEDVVRIAPFIGYLKQGYSPQMAAEMVGKIQVDYTKLSNWERKYARTAIPFWTFSTRTLALTAKDLIQNPGGRNANLIRAMNRSRDTESPVPEYIASSASIPLGELPDGSQRYLTGFGLGIEDSLKFGKSLTGDIGATLKELGSRANPLIKYPIEAMTNRSLFYDGPNGPQELTELDPTLGRIGANISDIATGSSTERAEPFISPVVEHAVANSPVARYATFARQLTDPRKWQSPLGAALDLGTGVKIKDVSPAAQDAIATQRAASLFRQLGGRNQSIPFFPKDKYEELPQEDKDTVDEIKELLKTVQDRRKMRREMEEARANKQR